MSCFPEGTGNEVLVRSRLPSTELVYVKVSGVIHDRGGEGEKKGAEIKRRMSLPDIRGGVDTNCLVSLKVRHVVPRDPSWLTRVREVFFFQRLPGTRGHVSLLWPVDRDPVTFLGHDSSNSRILTGRRTPNKRSSFTLCENFLTDILFYSDCGDSFLRQPVLSEDKIEKIPVYYSLRFSYVYLKENKDYNERKV